MLGQLKKTWELSIQYLLYQTGFKIWGP